MRISGRTHGVRIISRCNVESFKTPFRRCGPARDTPPASGCVPRQGRMNVDIRRARDVWMWTVPCADLPCIQKKMPTIERKKAPNCLENIKKGVTFAPAIADMAQLVEQRIRNAWVPGSSPGIGSILESGISTSVVHQLPKLRRRVRLPYSAPSGSIFPKRGFFYGVSMEEAFFFSPTPLPRSRITAACRHKAGSCARGQRTTPAREKKSLFF